MYICAYIHICVYILNKKMKKNWHTCAYLCSYVHGVRGRQVWRSVGDWCLAVLFMDVSLWQWPWCKWCWRLLILKMSIWVVGKQRLELYQKGIPLVTTIQYFIFLVDGYCGLVDYMQFLWRYSWQLRAPGEYCGPLLTIVHLMLVVSSQMSWNLQRKHNIELEFSLSFPYNV